MLNPSLDFTSPDFYPRNVSLAVLQNNNTYFVYDKHSLSEEEAVSLAEVFNNQKPDSLNFFIGFDNTEGNFRNGLGYIKGERITDIISEMDFRGIFMSEES